VVVTLGAAGCVVIDAGGTLHLPGISVRAIDTTGAGDCFSGVLATTLAEGASLPAAARRANVAAGLSVTTEGARGGMPDRAAIEAALSPTVQGRPTGYRNG
jgi:ribokinase